MPVQEGATVTGNPGHFRLLFSESNLQADTESKTMAMELPGGSLVRVTSRIKDNVAEALSYVPNAFLHDDVNGGRHLCRLETRREGTS